MGERVRHMVLANRGVLVGAAGTMALSLVLASVFLYSSLRPQTAQAPDSGSAADVSGPTLASATPLNPNEIELVFSEPLAADSVAVDDFSVEGGLSVTDVEHEKGTESVRLRLGSEQKPGASYRAVVAPKAIEDLAGNTNDELLASRFPGFGATGGSLAVTHGSGAERPTVRVAHRPDSVVVVDQIRLEARGGDVVVGGLSVHALASASNIFNELVEAWIFEDNGDGFFQADGRDRQLHRSRPFSGDASGAPAEFSNLRYLVREGQPREVWIVFRLGNLALDGRSIGSRVEYDDVKMLAGTVEMFDPVVSANSGDTIFIHSDGVLIATGRTVDPTTVEVKFDRRMSSQGMRSANFSVNGLPPLNVELLADGRTVVLRTVEPIESSAVNVGYTPTPRAKTPEEPITWATSAFTGPTYQSPNDTEPPTVPGNVNATAGTAAPLVARVSWNVSFDNNAVAGYRVWRSTSAAGDFRSIGTTPGAPYYDESGIPGQPYFYKISAYDPTSNESGLSASSTSITATWTQAPHATYGRSGNLCALCHISHNAATENAILRRTAGETASDLTLCYECHDGQGALANVKNGPVNSFALTSGHSVEDTESGDLTNSCSGCHGPHQDYTVTEGLWRADVNGNVVSGNDNTWCLACHDASHSWYEGGQAAYDALLAAPSRNATHYPTAGTFPGGDVYVNPAKNAHASVAATPGAEPGGCRDCHASHRTNSPYDALTHVIRPSTVVSVTSDRQTADYAEMCIRCHDGSFAGATNIKQHVTAGWDDPTVYGGHRVESTGASLPVGAPLPCYECHNPHGSRRGNSIMLSDGLGQSLTTTGTVEQVRQFCLTCHATSDLKVWNSASSSYADVTAGMFVLGLQRNGGTFGSGPDGEYNWLRLKDVDGHASGLAGGNDDETQSCYQCHGNDYASGKNNVHNPSPGESAGGLACLQCHDTTTYMQQTSSYHHAMVSDASGEPVIATPANLTATDAQRTCLVCHVDHDVFNPGLNPANTTGRSRNLRASVSAATVPGTLSTYLNTDFDVLGGASVCVSCHSSSMTKNATLRKTDKNAQTVKITTAGYQGSAHNYASRPATYVSDSSVFQSNCAKCHEDRYASEFQTGPDIVATHDATRVAMLTDAGQSGLAEDPEESFCMLCHSRSNDSAPNNPNGGTVYTATGEDVFSSSATMSATSLNVKAQFTRVEVQSSHPITGTALTARVECANCHNVHAAGGTDDIATNPNNTLWSTSDGMAVSYFSAWYAEADRAAASRANRDFCLACHDGLEPSVSGNGATVYVPYDVKLTDNQDVSEPNPTRRTDNKSLYTSRSHYNTTGEATGTARAVDLTCADCHDIHSSTLPALIGRPSRANPEAFLGQRYIYDPDDAAHAINANDNTVCLACHTAADAGYATSESRDASGYPMTGRWPGNAVAGVTYVPATNSGNPHKSANTQWPGLESQYAAGDCKNCHDPHGTANRYDQLRTKPAVADQLYEPGTYEFCFTCHKASGKAADNIDQFYPGGASAGTFAGHQIQSTDASIAAGSGLPCYDCHNPHGSASKYGLQVRDFGTSGKTFDLSTDAGVRDFCFVCHTTRLPAPYGRVTGAMEEITPGTQFVEGIDRTGGHLRLPLLGGFTGHDLADTESCYQCHGNRNYGAGGNNVHNPVVQELTYDCYTCHNSATYADMDITSSNRTNSYHHVLGDGGSVLADAPRGESASYPTSTSTLQCLSCHIDHEYWDTLRNPGGTNAGSNLRRTISDSDGANRSASDFSTSAGDDYGICVSCHTAKLDKDSSNQRSDGTSATPVIAGAVFSASAHQYAIQASSTVDSSASRPNCAKCHNSNIAASAATPAYFGVHASAEQNILSALGASMSDPLAATHCLRCHSQADDSVGGTAKPDAGYDWYGAASGGSMSATAEVVWEAFNQSGGSRHPIAPTATGYLTCESCHNPHIASETTPIVDPDNNYVVPAYSTVTDRVAYCMKCHDTAGPPSAVLDATTYIAATVTRTAAWADKEVRQAKSHWQVNGSFQSATIAACQDCHDKHGSDYEKLLGNFASESATPTIKGVAVTGNNPTVCWPCHGSAGLSYPTGVESSASVNLWESFRVAGGYISPTPSSTRTAVMWPGQAAWSQLGVVGPDSKKLSPHFNTALGYGGEPTNDCNTCHDVHGAVAAYDELKATYTSTDFTICFNCHDGVGIVGLTNIEGFYPPENGGSSSSDNAGHRIKTAGGNLGIGDGLPCYDCHGTHGSADGNAYLLNDSRWSGIVDPTDTQSREFCLGCHLTVDGYAMVDGSYVALSASDTDNLFEGLPRNPSTLTNRLKLPPLPGGNLSHLSTGSTACSEEGCHYLGSAVNAHNPSSGVSAGGATCYNCHIAYKAMDDAGGAVDGTLFGSTSKYHHVLGNGTQDGDIAPNEATTYPTTTQDVYCTSCHTDHNYFNATPGANLRQTIKSADGSGVTNTDFLASGDGGVCVSCHEASRAKDSSNQKDDGLSSATPKIVRDTFAASAHTYQIESYYSTATATFQANCAKCHDDAFDNNLQKSTFWNGNLVFGAHLTDEQRLLGSLGVTTTPLPDPLRETHCYRCHSQNTDASGGDRKLDAGYDWYGSAAGGAAMDAAAERVFDAFALGGSTHPVTPKPDGSTVACVNCHNVHVVSETTPVVDPNNTYNGASWATKPDKTAFCLGCHDANAADPAYAVGDLTYIPVAVSITGTDEALMNKQAYTGTSHMAEGGAIGAADVQTCVDCHDKHGSTAGKLLGLFNGTANVIGAETITSNDEVVCYGCHTNPSTNYTLQSRDASGYMDQGTWTGRTNWEVAYDPSAHTGSFHATTTVQWPGTTQWPAGDCKNCHDVHGTPNAKDMLRVSSGGTPNAYEFSASEFTFCFNCHDGSPSTRDIRQYYPVASGGTTTTARAGHQFTTDGPLFSAGDAMPCYECHNPHGTGSNSSYGLMVVAQVGPNAGDRVVLGDQANEITLDASPTAADVRSFCFACHTTNDTGAGWVGPNHGGGYQVMAAGTAYLGVSRTDETLGDLRLSGMPGHASTDSGLSCYECHALDGGNVHNPSQGPGAFAHMFDGGGDYASSGSYGVGDPAGCTNSGGGCHGTDSTYDNFASYHTTSTAAPACMLTCHSSGSFATFKATFDGDADCTDCHNSNYTNAPDRIELYNAPNDGHYSDTTHTAASMDATEPGFAGIANTACNDCHSVGLKAVHDNTSVGDVVCDECHNAESAVVTATAGWDNSCTNECHDGSPTAGKHTTIGANHTETESGCTGTGAGCHGSETDIAVIHAGASSGCKAAGCHTTDARPASVAGCTNGGSGCHAGYTGTNHGTVTGNEATHTAGDTQRDATYQGVTCVTCHAMTLYSEHNAASSGSITCLGCHNADSAVVDADWPNQANTSACADCHDGSPTPVAHGVYAAKHEGLSADEGAGCAETGNGCHPENTLAALHPTLGCAQCHSQSNAPASYTNCDDCHASYSTTHIAAGRSGDASHTTTSGMSGDPDATYENPNGEQCSDCHSAELGMSGSYAHKNSSAMITCGYCHNDTAPDSVTVIKTNSWSTRTCDECHDTYRGTYTVRHDTYGASTHAGAPQASQSCASGTGCHGNTGNDVRRLHDGDASGNSSNPGCTASGDGDFGTASGRGCHSLDGARPTQLSCGGSSDTGQCHVGYLDGNHSSAAYEKHVATTSPSILASNDTSISAHGNGCGRCHQDGETTNTGANTAITDIDSPATLSLLHDTDPVLGRTGCAVCHGNPRLNGGGTLGGVHTPECSSCHTSFQTNYHRTYDASHTTDTSGYTCTMGACHSTNIITEHADYEKPTAGGLTYHSTADASNNNIVQTQSTSPVLVKTITVNNTPGGEKHDYLRVDWTLRTSQAANAANGRVVVKDGPTTVFTGPDRNTLSTAYVPFIEDPIDISSVGLNRDLTIELYIWQVNASRIAYNDTFEARLGSIPYTYTPTDDCDICHFNTGRVDNWGSAEASDPVLPATGLLPGFDAQCETCHPYFENRHYSHKATTSSDGCLNGCHTYAPAISGISLDTATATGKYSLWAQHADLEALGSRETSGWGDNTTGNGGTIEAGCGVGPDGRNCHGTGLPQSSECVDCHGPSEMNDTQDHHDVHVLDASGGVPQPAASIDTTFGAGCINVCHAQALDWIHGLGITAPYGGITYRSTSGATGSMSCATCHKATPGSPIYNTNNGGGIMDGTLKCVDCHTGGAWPGSASKPHQGDTVDGSSLLTGANVYANDFRTSFSVGAHRVAPYTVAFTQVYSYSGTAWQRGTGAGTNFTFNVSTAAAGSANAAALLRSAVTVGTLKAGGTALSTSTTLYCADCHGTFTATGPQGASTPISMYSGFTQDWSSWRPTGWIGTNPSTTVICYRCHDLTLQTSTSHLHQSNAGHDEACVACHIGIPHGWKRPKLLVRKAGAGDVQGAGDPAPYNVDPEVVGGLIGFNGSGTGLSATTWTNSGYCDAYKGTTNCTKDHDASPISP